MSSKEGRLPTAIKSLAGIVFVRNICTPVGWRKSFTGSVLSCKVPAAGFTEWKQFKRLFLLFASVQYGGVYMTGGLRFVVCLQEAGWNQARRI